MITTLISMYAAGTLMGNNLPSSIPHTMPWTDNKVLESSAVPQKNPKNIAPVIKAKSALAIDLQNGVILYEKNVHEILPIASITKLMTAIIILEENNPQEVLKVSKNAAKTGGSKIWLAQDEKITVENLLYAILINSANDAATALAEYNSKTAEDFVAKMNKKSKDLGLTSTWFFNPTGLDGNPETSPPEPSSTEPDNQSKLIKPALSKTENAKNNSSTAYDLALLGHYAYGKSFVRRAVVKKDYEIESTDGNLKHPLKTTNELLKSYLKVLGLKTGTTDEAGACLIAIIENNEGHDILTVVLNSPNRYNETKILADWVFRSYTWK